MFQKNMIINFVGSFGPSGSGEISDETHIVRSFEELGHSVRKVPRDIWREICNGEWNPNWEGRQPLEKVDINIIAKWDKFENGKYIKDLKAYTNAPVFYWVWDSVDLGIEWHKLMAKEADLYLSGELGRSHEFLLHDIKFYYFQFDCVDGDIKTFSGLDKIYDVSYLGTYDNQAGRMDILREINKEISIQVWGSNYKEWEQQGFKSHPAVFGEEANKVITQSKIVLGTSCDPHLYGYWSNRVGRVLRAEGLLLQQYTPGMENFLHNSVDYYSTAQEAVEKINHILNDYKLDGASHAVSPPQNLWSWTSTRKVADLCIMIERYLKENNGKEWLLP